MTRSDDRSESRELRRWRILVRHDGKGQGGVCCHAVLCPCAVCGSAKDRPGWARVPGRHGGEASALCVGSDDVGLDSLVLSYQEESTKKAAAIDPKPPHRPVWG